jgi:hypothetical protein
VRIDVTTDAGPKPTKQRVALSFQSALAFGLPIDATIDLDNSI